MIMPHCDPSILHAPGECGYCDDCPEAQELRRQSRINFSGRHDSDKVPCPSTYFRTEEVVNLWRGNRAQAREQLGEDIMLSKQGKIISVSRDYIHNNIVFTHIDVVFTDTAPEKIMELEGLKGKIVQVDEVLPMSDEKELLEGQCTVMGTDFCRNQGGPCACRFEESHENAHVCVSCNGPVGKSSKVGNPTEYAEADEDENQCSCPEEDDVMAYIKELETRLEETQACLDIEFGTGKRLQGRLEETEAELRRERDGRGVSRLFNEVYEAKGKKLEDDDCDCPVEVVETGLHGEALKELAMLTVADLTKERVRDLERIKTLERDAVLYKRLFDAERVMASAAVGRIEELERCYGE